MINYSEVCHFTEDSNFVKFNRYVKSINKQVNYDIKDLGNWLKGSKISLNVG